MTPISQELDRVEQEIVRLTTVRDYLRQRAGETNGGTVKRRRRPRGRVTAAVAAEEVLAGADGPMRTPELLDAIRERGATMSNADNLFKTLSRNPRFTKAGRGLWKLAG